MDWTLVEAPTEDPVDLAEAKKHCKVEFSADDGEIDTLIEAARDAAEQYLGRGLLTQKWDLVLCGWADELWLPMAAPLQSVEYIKYYDTAGTLQTLATTVRTVETVSEPGRILLAPNQIWPTHQTRQDAISIRYQVGWDDVSKVPSGIKLGMLLLIGHWYKHREAFLTSSIHELPKGVEALWAPHRVWLRPPVAA